MIELAGQASYNNREVFHITRQRENDMIKINDYQEPDHYRAICEDNYNVSRTCEYEKNEMHHIHNTCEILLVEEGVADYFIRGTTYHVESGDLLIIGAMEHHMRRIASCPYLRYGLTLKLSYFRSLDAEQQLWNVFSTPSQKLFQMRCKKIAPESFELLIKLLAELKEEQESGRPFSAQYVRAVVTQIAIVLFRLLNIGTEQENDSSMRLRIQEIKEYVDSHFREEITLKILSDHFYLHPTTISKNFHRYCKIPLNRYINNVRVCEAARLLENGNETVSMIAVKCGFGHTNTFLRQFKEIMEITPLQYRRNFQ